MKIYKKKIQIGVIGSAGWEEYPGKKPNRKLYKLAYEVGKLIALKQAILICGGKGGIMMEVCRGAKENNGITVGVVSGNKRNTANTYVDIEVVSGFSNYAEEGIIVSMSDGIIAIGGGAGTLQEIATAYRNKKTIVAIQNSGGWAKITAGTYLDERKTVKIYATSSPNEAVRILIKKIKSKKCDTICI